jgi:hypothetical protein
MRDRDTAAVVLAFALAGCPLATSTTTTTTLTASRPVGGNSAATPPSTPAVASTPTAGTGGTPRATVPNLIGKTPEQARALVKAAGFAAEPEATHPLECEGAPREPGLINCQDPEAGQVIERYRMITIHVYREQVITGAIVRRQLEALHGLTPDQARQQLKKLGHDGKVDIGDVTTSGGSHAYLKECGQNKVCYTSGESGIGIHDDLVLYINPTLKIAPPP